MGRVISFYLLVGCGSSRRIDPIDGAVSDAEVSGLARDVRPSIDGDIIDTDEEVGLDAFAFDQDTFTGPDVRRLAMSELTIRQLFCRCAVAAGEFENAAVCLMASPPTLDSEEEIGCSELAFEGRPEDIPIFNCRVDSFERYVTCLTIAGCDVTVPWSENFQRCSENQQAENRICGALSVATNEARRFCLEL